jgi:hypothetical protein
LFVHDPGWLFDKAEPFVEMQHRVIRRVILAHQPLLVQRYETASVQRLRRLQFAADKLIEHRTCIKVAGAYTVLPQTGGTVGSSTTLSVGSAVVDAATRLKADLGELAGEAELEPARYATVLRQYHLDHLSADGAWATEEGVAMHTFGAVFAEVRVDADLCVPHVLRVVAVYSAGRIVNPKILTRAARHGRAGRSDGDTSGQGEAHQRWGDQHGPKNFTHRYTSRM